MHNSQFLHQVCNSRFSRISKWSEERERPHLVNTKATFYYTHRLVTLITPIEDRLAFVNVCNISAYLLHHIRFECIAYKSKTGLHKNTLSVCVYGNSSTHQSRFRICAVIFSYVTNDLSQMTAQFTSQLSIFVSIVLEIISTGNTRFAKLKERESSLVGACSLSINTSCPMNGSTNSFDFIGNCSSL